ncbi:DUF1127 domain-containing protein [Roseibium porphyridii]|uniref:DUF1127 domain-containing protein n=2 Tax=Stappiaceae TaxID=2821832 RepID=A0ABY8F3F2_9HYPH|nr:DUF1127 domain-containing protein [Roseibium sp. KMA01]WFE90028.1 DUF1127 domain-containing protein [Roseibium sp. KMA01]
MAFSFSRLAPLFRGFVNLLSQFGIAAMQTCALSAKMAGLNYVQRKTVHDTSSAPSQRNTPMAFDMISGFVRDVRAAHRTANEIERLNHMNTAQLADLGLERSDIASHAFGKYFKKR